MTTRERVFVWVIIFSLIGVFIASVSDVLLPFVFGMLVAYFLDPAADKLESFGVSRTLSTLFILTIFFFVFFLALAFLIPMMFEQLSMLLQKIPAYVTMLQDNYGEKLSFFASTLDQEQLSKAGDIAANASRYILQFTTGLVQNVLSSGFAILNLLSLLLISPIVAFYLLRDWDIVVERVDGLLPRKQANIIRTQVKLIDETLSAWIRGQFNVCLILGIVYATGLYLVGLDFGILIGLGTGILSFIPFVGNIVGIILSLCVGYFQFDGAIASLGSIVLVFMIGQVLEGNFLTPKLVGDKIGLHPVWVIFGLLAGASLMGFVGVLIALPLTAIIGVLVRFTIEQYRTGTLYSDTTYVGKKLQGVKKK